MTQAQQEVLVITLVGVVLGLVLATLTVLVLECIS